MLTICIAAYNEEKNLGTSLRYLEKSLNELNFKKKPQIIICLNGCNDKTANIVRKIIPKYSFPISVVRSKKGKLKAHQRMLDIVRGDSLIMFIDADVLVPKKTIQNIMGEFKKDKKVKIVSAYPFILRPKRLTIGKMFIFNILNIKRIYPKIEIAKNDVSMFHSSSEDFEKKSRIYFHGRCFVLRDKTIYEFPEKNSKIRGDDTFLTRTTLYKYGKGSIKVLFNSAVYCAPLLSIRDHLKTEYRIRKDVDQINKEYPKFKKFGKKTEMTLNREYLRELPQNVKIWAILYFGLRIFEKFSYNIFKYWIDLDSIWSYNNKESLEENIIK